MMPDWIEQLWKQYGDALPFFIVALSILIILLYAVVGHKRVAARLSSYWTVMIRGCLMVALVLTAILAVGNYTRIGHWPYNNYLNGWEFYHYYMGTKYAPEIGYRGLYAASLIADRETKLKYSNKKKAIRDLDTGRYRSVAGVFKDEDEFKGLFSQRRWGEWRGDVVYFKGVLSQRRWNGVLRDKGYNGTPVWSAVVGGFLSNQVPTSSQGGMLFLALLDPLLITLALLCVWWAFGPVPMLLMVCLIGSHYMMHFSHMKGAFLRTDYAMCLVMAMCFIKQKWYKTAGVLLGYSIMSRIFPAVFLFGIGAKFFWDFIYHPRVEARSRDGLTDGSLKGLVLIGWDSVWRRVNLNHLRLFLACGLTIALLLVFSLVYFEGVDIWKDFGEKIGKHNSDVSPWRIGFKQLYANEWVNGAPQLRRKMYTDHQTLWWSIQACVLLVSLYLVKGLKEHQAFAYGFVLVFFMAASTYYYYILLAVPLLFFAEYFDRPSRAIGLVMMFLTGAVGYAFNRGFDHVPRWLESRPALSWLTGPFKPLIEMKGWVQNFPTYYWLSWLIMGMVAYMMALSFAQTQQEAFNARAEGKRLEDGPGGSGADHATA